jgi:DNA-binding NarL/FixJ family response regulator
MSADRVRTRTEAGPPAGDAGDLERGRRSVAAWAWQEAHAALARADRTTPLGAEDLELFATAAYMIGRDDEYRQVLERAHHAHLTAGNAQRAVRCAFWAGLSHLTKGELAPASGWFARGQRLLDLDDRVCVERGYLLIPVLLGHVAHGDHEAAYVTAGEAAEIGAQFGDADLVALVVQEQGHALIRQGRAGEGLRLLDETMTAVMIGELSPIVTGLVYCNTIAFCQDVLELRRAREWTAALTRWVERQPDMVAHTGRCLVHRAEIMELEGQWQDALLEARRASERLALGTGGRLAAGNALYRQGEILRLRGDFVAAEDVYREASGYGWEPQPGLALLRLAQGNSDAAAAAIGRALDESSERLTRARLLPAYVEIMLANGRVEEADRASRELHEIADAQDSLVLHALAARARAEMALSEGDARAALVALREAFRGWQELEVPYEIARVRLLVGLACRALGDNDTAALEFEAARATFERLGAGPDLSRLDSLNETAPPDTHGLTLRELEVMRLLAAGQTNKQIAAALVLSKRTVDRHVSNIFRKLGVSSRAAATAYGYEHDLI